MNEGLIIIRECEGRMSIMKEEDSNQWRRFPDMTKVADFISETVKMYGINDKFHVVKYCGRIELIEEVERKMLITVDKKHV